MSKVNYSSDSPYAKTPQTVWYLAGFVKRNIPRDGTDRSYIIPAKFSKRPDNAAYELFGNHELWWVFAMLNPNSLIDPINDFTPGKTIRIPNRERLRSAL